MSNDLFNLSENISEPIYTVNDIDFITPHDIAINEYKKFIDCFNGDNNYVLVEFYDPSCTPCLKYNTIFIKVMDAIKDHNDIKSCQINLRDIEVDDASYKEILSHIPNHDEIVYPNNILYYHNEVKDTLKGMVSFDEIMEWLNSYIQPKISY